MGGDGGDAAASPPPSPPWGPVRIGGQVERVDGSALSYGEFVERYLKGNRPVVLTGLMAGWRACDEWTAQQRPRLRFISRHFGRSLVQVADCGTKEFTDQKRLEMSVSDFIRHWLELPADSSSSGSPSSLYLKDWHFVKEYPDYLAYTTPSFFMDDWLNLYLDSHCMHRDSDIHRDKNEINCADYRFVYMGAKGTWTPLHADVFRSYSWSANVCGKKLWYFLPPSQCHLVFDRNLKNSVYDIRDVSEVNFPNIKKTVWWECTQEQNEIIFVPSGWYHQVHNLEDTISINHNWFNAYNLSWVWDLLVKDYNEAKEYIDDIREICDDFESLCQRNLAANTGMNFYDFFIFITRFALANLIQLHDSRHVSDTISNLSKNHHIICNLISIRAVASSMISHEAFSEGNLSSCSEENHSAFSDVGKILGDKNFLKLCKELSSIHQLIHKTCQHDSGRTTLPAKEEIFLLDYWNLELVESNSKISGPKDLVALIEQVIRKHYSVCTDCDLRLPSVLHDNETWAVKK